jgi:hypothetical protein
MTASGTFPDILAAPTNVRYGVNRTWQNAATMSLIDLGCVKTHTSPKCRKYGSLIRYRALGAQYDSALLMAIAPGSFHALGNCWSFHTAKTRSGHRGRGQQEQSVFTSVDQPASS